MPIRITIRKDGPYRVEIEGDDAFSQFSLVDHEGTAIPLPGPKFSLCRCGASSRKPFCDATHSKIGFKGAMEAAQQLDATLGVQGSAAATAPGAQGGEAPGTGQPPASGGPTGPSDKPRVP